MKMNIGIYALIKCAEEFFIWKQKRDHVLAQIIMAKGIRLREKYRALNYCKKVSDQHNLAGKLGITKKDSEERYFFLANFLHKKFLKHIKYIFDKWEVFTQHRFTFVPPNEFLLYDNWLDVINLNKAPPDVF